MNAAAGTLRRLERILAMVPWLLEHPGVSVDEVSERFDAPRAEVLHDLDVLGYCGLPGYGGGDLVEASIVGDRVVVRMADFFRRPLRLSLREAVTLVLAARALASVEGLAESQALRSALGKLERMLGAAVADDRLDEQVTPRIAVDLTAAGDEHLPVLRRALQQRRVVRLTYRSASKGEETERDVEPWTLAGAHGSWYLQGYCRTVQAPRDFRLDRIRHLDVTDEVAEPVQGSGAPAPPRYEPGPDDEQIVLDLAPEAWWVAEWAVVEDVSDDDHTRRVTLRTGHREWLARLLLGLGPAVRVVEPADLAADVAELAATVLVRYRED